MLRSEEHLAVDIVRVPLRRVTLRKQIVTEMRTVDVLVRREELVVEQQSLPSSAEPVAAVSNIGEPLRIVLHEEVPVITVTATPYQAVTVFVDVVDDTETVSDSVRHERIVAE